MKRFLVILLAAMMMLVGCSKTESDDSFKILTSFYPLYILTLNVTDGAEGVTVENMASQQTGCLHDYQLTGRDMKKLNNCDVFIINGEMESFLDKAIAAIGQKNTVTATQGIDFITSNGEKNPHCWVSPTLAAQMTENIAERLAELDPDNGELYRANAKKYSRELIAMGQEMKDELKDVQNKNIVTFHEAFPYLANETGLTVCATIQREPGTEPTAAEINETIDIIRKSDVAALFAEPQYSGSATRVIGSETGLKVYTLNPVTDGADDRGAYVEIMKKNLGTLKEALVDE